MLRIRPSNFSHEPLWSVQGELDDYCLQSFSCSTHVRAPLKQPVVPQLARKHDNSDAEGVLLRAGARDPEADTWPGGDAAAPVSSALDAGSVGDHPRQDLDLAKQTAESDHQRAGAVEHSIFQSAVAPSACDCDLCAAFCR